LAFQIQTVLVHGSKIRFYVVNDAVAKGMNLTVSCLSDSLDLIKPTAKLLRLQCDSGSENNNYALYTYVSVMVLSGAFETVEVHRLPPGFAA
jgi:hypothetical protein